MAQTKHQFVYKLLDASGIANFTDEIISSGKVAQDKIAQVPAGQHTWENTVKAFEDAMAKASNDSSFVTFPSSVSMDKSVRDASAEAKKKINEFSIDTYMREDIYKALLEYKKLGEKLSDVDQRLLDKTLEDFERNGLGLTTEKREQLKTLKKKISELSIKATQNMNEEAAKFLFSEEELDGLGDLVKNLPRDSQGKVIVSLKYPEYFPLQKHCKVEATRKKMETEFSSRCQAENIPILAEIIKLRHEAAVLLGFPNHASYVLKVRMARDPDTVNKFLDDLIAKLEKPLDSDVEQVLSWKKKDCASRGIPDDGKLNAWDFNFYMNKILEEEYNVNENEIKDYFPLEVVTKGIFDVYQELLGLTFQEVKDFVHWHQDVQLFEVYDAADPTKYIGQFYIDLFPRDGKYGHAAVFGIQKGYYLANGTWQHPAAALLANFSKPTAEFPSLLKHGEVVTFFHEMGHVFHQICTEAKYNRFSGTSVERDFVEAPSQMLENWCWEKEVLRRISSHKVTHTPIPDELVDRMIKARNANVGLLNRRQLFFGKFDMVIHTTAEVANLGDLYGEMRTKITKVLNTPGTNGAAAWGHIFGGYDASYYGYMWSEVFSCDMFSMFSASGVMDKTLGKRYRDIILKKGGTKDGMDLLKEFLGREPSPEAFLKQKNIL